MDFVERTLFRALIASALDAREPGCWRPAVDVYREVDGWLCKFDLAGVRGEDVDVQAIGRRLRVTGVRRDRTLQAGREPYSMEISYHTFERSVELPCDLQDCRVECSFDAGMLLVTIQETRP
ncbi:MAG TPA: Hsp20/alpha crystallin family protein [Planctomycetota bacterium]